MRLFSTEAVSKYHPDKYTDSDLKELANEKLVEVNEAYEMLTKKTSQSSSYASRSGNGTFLGCEDCLEIFLVFRSDFFLDPVRNWSLAKPEESFLELFVASVVKEPEGSSP